MISASSLDVAYSAYKLIREILKDMRKGKEEKFATAESDLIEVITVLSGTLRTMVGIVHPMRKLPTNKIDKFPQAFNDFYMDFKLSYDTNSFDEARTRCHKIDLIRKRLDLGWFLWNRDKAEEIKRLLQQLVQLDVDWFGQVARWMDKVNSDVEGIHRLVQKGKTTEAIATTKQVVSSLSDDFNTYKKMLKEMNDTISELTQRY